MSKYIHINNNIIKISSVDAVTKIKEKSPSIHYGIFFFDVLISGEKIEIKEQYSSGKDEYRNQALFDIETHRNFLLEALHYES